MTGRDESAEEAHRIAAGQAWTPDRVLAELDRIRFVDSELRNALQRSRDEIVPRLVNAMSERSGAARLNAACLLLELGDATGMAGLLEFLRGDDAEMRGRALHWLAGLPWNRDKGGYQVPLDKEAVFAAVAPLVDAPEVKISDAAIGVLERLGTREADERVASLIAHSEPTIRFRAMQFLAKRGEDRGAQAIIEALLAEGDRRNAHQLTDAIADLCRQGDAATRASACVIAMRYVRDHLDSDDNGVANEVWHCLEGIAAVAPAEERTLLSDVLASKLLWWVRGIALTRLAQLEGSAGLDRLCGALREKDYREAAANGLATLAAGTHDPRVIDALAEALAEASDGRAVAALVRAMVAVGGAPQAVLEKAMERASPSIAMTIHWLLHDIEAKHLAESLVAAGIPMPSDEKMSEYAAQWREKHDADGILLDMLAEAGRLTGFDCKTVDSPADHAELLHDLSTISAPFAIEDTSQTIEPDGRCKLRFVHAGKGYSFIAEDMGRYYDLRTVLGSLNGILAGLGRAERFFQLYTGDTMGLVLFAHEAPFLEVARDLRIPLELDPDRARRSGIAYTNYVLSSLNLK